MLSEPPTEISSDFGADGSGHKLMGDQNVPVCVIQRQMRERGLHGIGVGLDLLRFRFIKTADMRGFDERQHINVDNPYVSCRETGVTVPS